jgi:NitT/TauT family transport system ATP-binding protein
MDEPFGHVDEITARGLRWELQDICSRVSMTAVFVTHNPREAAFLADRILVLSSVPARMTGELSVTLARPRTPESTQLATVVASIYGLLDRDNRGNSR